MIHVLTVHWKSDRWVDIQLKYLKKYITVPYKVYASLNFLPQEHQKKYFYCSTEEIQSHAKKLNALADVAIKGAADDDWLLFIDGDAFPIAEIEPFVRDKLQQFPLLAVQRKENAGDIQPHPSFCVTTAKFWKDIDGDWEKGYQWKGVDGEMVTDVGGNLLEKLSIHKAEWLPLLRSNRKNLHELWFGIYEDLIYHHGAGFRKPASRVDGPAPSSGLFSGSKNGFLGKIYQSIARKKRRKIIKKNQRIAEEIFQNIEKDPEFFRCFQ